MFLYTSRTRRTSSSPRLPLRMSPIVLCVRDMIDKIVKHPRRHLPCEGERDPLPSALPFLPCLLASLFVTKSERPGAAQAASNTHDHLCRRPRVWSLALAGFLSSFPPFPSLLQVPCLCDRGSVLMVWCGCLCAACRRTTRRTTVFDGRVRRSASFRARNSGPRKCSTVRFRPCSTVSFLPISEAFNQKHHALMTEQNVSFPKHQKAEYQSLSLESRTSSR